MKTKKLSVLFLLTFAAACFITGCSALSFDASGYIKACLDANAHGEFEAYSEFTNTPVEDIEKLYNSNIDTEISYLAAYDISEQQEEDFRNLFIDIYKNFKYEVGEATKNDDDSYTVPVTTYQLIIFKGVMSGAEDYITNYAQEQVEAGNSPTQDELEQLVLNYMYDALKANLDKLEYADPVTVDITVSPTKQGSSTVYSASQSELQALMESFTDVENAQ